MGPRKLNTLFRFSSSQNQRVMQEVRTSQFSFFSLRSHKSDLDVCLSELKVWVPVLIGLQIILSFVYYLVYLKFLLFCCIGLQVKDNYRTICSVDSITIRDTLAQLLLKTEKNSNNSDICFLCLHIHSENKDILISHYSWYGLSNNEHQQTE